ncbi:MAG: acyclic terpene utilization AtuA family protein [Rhizobiaceae bacterium]
MANPGSVSIGGASGYWGEASHATAQLLTADKLDFLVYDYLAEITMSIMARARAKNPKAGYAGDFVSGALAPNIEEIARRRVRVISNAGGVNPRFCGTAVRALVAEKGLDLKVAVISGDDLMARTCDFCDVTEMFSGESFPDREKLLSANAYLGAFPIAKALDKSADIVITGRCVDSAITLGACIHSFGWKVDDFDLLSAGSLAGHLIECGPQATGGNFTDWRDAGEIAEIGYPVAKVSSDGNCIVTKPEGTGGLVSPLTVGEQMLYETSDPRAYLLPDVTCDFSEVTLEQNGPDRVLVKGARGRAPSLQYKVSATWMDGYRAGQTFLFNGFEAADKARLFAEAIFDRARKKLRDMNAGDFEETSIEVFGEDSSGYREVMLKLAARHQDARAIGLFLKEMTGIALATPAGMSAFTGGGRPRPSPVVRLFSFLTEKADIEVRLAFDDSNGEVVSLPAIKTGKSPVNLTNPQPDSFEAGSDLIKVSLIALAVARSGDKGNKANIGVMAREARFLPYIWEALSEEAVARHFANCLEGGDSQSDVERFYLPGSHAINFLLNNALGGGGIASLRQDAQAKGYGQKMLSMPVAIPVQWAQELDRVA